MKPSSSTRPSGRSVVLAFAGAAAAAVALVVVALLFRNDGNAPPPSPTPGVELAGIPQDDRLLGNPAAKITLIEYADAQCPGCRFYTEEIFPTVANDYVRPGKVKNEFRGFPFIGPDSVKALRFIYAAGLQDKLWQFQEALYRNQGGENDGWVTDDLLREITSEILGLDVDKLFADAESDEIAAEVNAAPDEAEAAGVKGTPSLFVKIGNAEPYYIQVSNVEEMRAALDDALEG
jgi:protein-disulfide isomerase